MTNLQNALFLRFESDASDAAGPAPQPSPGYPAGIDVVQLASGSPRALPGEGLVLLRVTYAPGAVIEPHTNPGASVYSVESGTIELTIETGVASLQRAGSNETRDLPAGQSVSMKTGDSVFYDVGTTHRTRNPGTEPAVITVAAIFVPNKPILQPAK